MDVYFVMIVFFISFVGSYFSGMLGIGGAVINYPLLFYVPPMLGIEAFSSYEVSGIVAIQVLVATFSGALGHRKSGNLNHSLIVYMGISVLVGSLMGSVGSSFMTEGAINLIYGVLALMAVAMMLIPVTGTEYSGQINYSKRIASLCSFVIGVGAGIVGAGGAFLLIPIMLVVLRIPIRVTIASSLAITFISAIGTSIGKISTGQVPFVPTIIAAVASVIAAQLGVATGKRIDVKVLKVILVLLIVGTSIKIWLDILL